MQHYRLGIVVLFILGLTGCQVWQAQDLERLDATAALPNQSEPGKVQIRFWDNVAGAKVEALTALASYPDSPTETSELQQLQSLNNRSDNYGAMIQGFIAPPATGEYRFFVSGDDETQFWLSTDETPANAELAATVPGWTYRESYNQYSSQQSGVKILEAGKKYYFQLVFKEGIGDDHFSVAWEGPTFPMTVIDSSALYSWSKPIYASDEDAEKAYSLGYRVGFTDGKENLAFDEGYPPLDSDQDGIYDNWEVVMGLNPSNAADASADPDNDLLTALEEFTLGTRENNTDTDADGIPDGAEYAYALDPLDASDASADFDGDGISNYEEYLAGTKLDDPQDYPVVESPLAPGFVGQYFSGMAFDQFLLNRTEEALNFNWSTDAPFAGAPEERFSVRWYGVFTAPHSSGSRAYRFELRTDDGARLFFGNEEVISSWVDRGPTTDVIERSFNAGDEIPVLVEYYENTGGAVAQLTISDAQTGGVLATTDVIGSLGLSLESSTDTDADGLPDTWELAFGTNILVNDSAETFNTAGVSALEAYQSNLNPWTLEPLSESPPSEDTNGSVTPEPTGSVTLTWTAPSTRTDGSSISLSEIDHYLLSYGQSETNLDQTVRVESDQTSYTFEGLATGTWYFSIQVTDTKGLSSQTSEPVSQTVQ
jgi:hypothetical protein